MTRTPGCVIVVSVPSITVVMAAIASYPAALFRLVSTTEGGTITIYGVNDSTMNQGYDLSLPALGHRSMVKQPTASKARTAMEPRRMSNLLLRWRLAILACVAYPGVDDW